MVETRPAPMFVADALGLDFLNSVAAPWGHEIEWIAHGQDLLAWLEHAGAVPADVVASMRERAVLGELDQVAAQARSLRDWFRRFVHTHAGRAITPAAVAELAPLLALLERDDAYGAVEQAPKTDRQALRWIWRRRWRTPDSLLLPVAQAMAQLVCDADFTQVKTCEGPTCTMVFLDTTKSRTRRWCSMAVCGNRAKQAAHRARARGPAGPVMAARRNG
jgi:predicted RNA-binding Zn ribbon-like protein